MWQNSVQFHVNGQQYRVYTCVQYLVVSQYGIQYLANHSLFISALVRDWVGLVVLLVCSIDPSWPSDSPVMCLARAFLYDTVFTFNVNSCSNIRELKQSLWGFLYERGQAQLKSVETAKSEYNIVNTWGMFLLASGMYFSASHAHVDPLFYTSRGCYVHYRPKV